jgi:hypothetical protein
MQAKTSIVITSIASPNRVLRDIAQQCANRSLDFYVIGDSKSPKDFHIDGCSFFSIDQQLATGLKTAELCPQRHYARKNIGYLLAIQDGSQMIVETDDDNLPLEPFWGPRQRVQRVPAVHQRGWVNAYRYFTEANIWPRGLPLDAVQQSAPGLDELATEDLDCPIQQGLADDNPDVDAIYRLILPLPLQFAPDRKIGLKPGVWCPFNSQNTTWWPHAFPLLYLPAYCSFRMTDIWRSFVAQRIAWENGWSLLFESATVIQDRNDHSLMRDFQDEIPGYLNNRAMAEELDKLDLRPGLEHIADNLLVCYEMLIRREWVGAQELPLLNGWIADLKQLGALKAGSAAGL